MAKRVPTLQLESLDNMLDFPRKEEITTAQAPSVANNNRIIEELEIVGLKGFPNHDTKFPLYIGQRLDDMVESIKQHGVAMPIIVWLTDDGRYVIISGHNRTNAARLAGMQTVPAIIRHGLTMEEAEDLFYELNFRQRGLAAHYIHRHLKNVQVPTEMYDAVYRHEKILGLVSYHWLDEAKLRGGDTWDKAAVAAISVQNWLEEVRGGATAALGHAMQSPVEAELRSFASNYENDGMDDEMEM